MLYAIEDTKSTLERGFQKEKDVGSATGIVHVDNSDGIRGKLTNVVCQGSIVSMKLGLLPASASSPANVSISTTLCDQRKIQNIFLSIIINVSKL